jgi:hypothetical protein
MGMAPTAVSEEPRQGMSAEHREEDRGLARRMYRSNTS